MKLQRFANIYDEMIDTYNRSIQETQSRIGQDEAEKQRLINDYNAQYQNQLNEYQQLQDQNKANIESWANTQKDLQQKQTDYEVGLINQAKEQAEKETKTEQANAYIDYQKGLNEFGGSSEQLASQGLQGTGFAKNQDIAMNITYQNRVASANAALQKANTDYNNQMQQALLSNDANLAALAYQEMQQQYQLALDGFTYRTNLWNQKLNYETQTNNTYWDRINNYRNQIKNYQDSINATKQAKAAMEEQQRQFNAQMSYNYSRSGGGGSSGGGGGYSDSYAVNTAYYQGDLNSDASKYGTFSNGYQPKGISGHGELSKTGNTLTFRTQTLSGQGQTVTQNIWKAKDGTKWYWDGRYNKYIQIK